MAFCKLGSKADSQIIFKGTHTNFHFGRRGIKSNQSIYSLHSFGIVIFPILENTAVPLAEDSLAPACMPHSFKGRGSARIKGFFLHTHKTVHLAAIRWGVSSSLKNFAVNAITSSSFSLWLEKSYPISIHPKKFRTESEGK